MLLLKSLYLLVANFANAFSLAASLENVTQVKMELTIKIILAFLPILFLGCGEEEIKNKNLFNTDIININVSKSIFSKELIASREILDTLKNISDSIIIDSVKHYNAVKSTIYKNRKGRTYFIVLENPVGTITYLALKRDSVYLNCAEYFGNGQIMCKFSVTEEGIREGKFKCFNKNGDCIRTGYFRNGKEIKDSTKNNNDG